MTHPIQPTPADPDSGRPEAASPAGTDPAAGADPVARRRHLVRMAMSGAPLMVMLPTSASAFAMASAYRAAQNDAQSSPATVVNANDGWLRVPATKMQPKTGTTGLSPLYKVGTRYYLQTNGTEVFGITDANYDTSTVYLLVLFSANYTGTPSIDGGIPYPIRASGQGLHLSAWNSVNPSGTRAYDGVNWVS